ncbi:LOW QUALITY PROTEIN: NHS-like protein 1 [Phyllopteryx taeniolatus]|uniref:LOW QUALITY PROTEIN: NHS-like protein 1 n=1 Tax=Phyllopteryx taeniolatus TaxID=161469 RepID=UPI002AD53BC6|nr:LOW QUALITY PROTEIN: NHS-like protein 1 [Phyllopteryx taeniolatus]
MPFHQRSVEPRRVSRLPARGKARRAAAPFASLAEVGCHTLGNVIRQLADLSRLAADVFLGIESEAAAVARRSWRLQGRLRTLHARVGVLEPKRVPIQHRGRSHAPPTTLPACACVCVCVCARASLRTGPPRGGVMMATGGPRKRERESESTIVRTADARSPAPSDDVSAELRLLRLSRIYPDRGIMVFIGTSLKSVIKYFKRKAVSSLDEESKWTVHYAAPWHQQENVFLPGSRPPCVEDLHRQAKVNLKSALRECDKLRKDGFRSSQYYSQGPIFSDTPQSGSSLHDDDVDDDDEKKSLASAAEDDRSRPSTRPQTPGDETPGNETPGNEADVTGGPALPTPEERMRRTAQSVPTDIVAINVTGAVFDRQASVRRSLVNADTVSRRPKKVKRRKTISGLPDDVDLELASQGRGGELRPHSMFVPGQYSTLGRAGSVNSALRRSRTRDSGCQTEEVKIVPPSVRRIRAQRGQGIAAQMAGISASSSTGSLSVCSGDGSAVLTLPRQRIGDPSRFNSLPRQGARVSLGADPICSSTPIKSEVESGDRGAPQRQIGKLQADDTAVHVRNAPRTGTVPRPRSQEVRRTRSSEWGGGPARVVSPHAAYSTSLIPNATLSGSSEIVALSASGQRSRSPTSAHPRARPLGPAPYEDRRAPGPAAFTRSAACPEPAGESGCTSAEEQWIYDTPENLPVPHRTLTSSYSTPINQLYTSLEASSRTTTDSGSLYSQDNDGYYTSMHLDSGLRSHGHGSGHGAAAARATRHSMYECRETAGQDEYGSSYADRSLSRSVSLRKSKKPPLPPTRTDSLRRKPGPKKPIGGVSAIGGAGEVNDGTLNESLIATLQQSLQLGLKPGKGQGASPSSPSHSPSSDYEDPWVLRPRSQSSVSVGSSATSLAAGANGVSDAYSLCHVTPANSDTSSLRSDYADSWGFYMEYPRNHGDQSAPTPAAQTADGLSTGPQPGERQSGSDVHADDRDPGVPVQEESAAAKAKTSSPERVHRLTSPSSGYSSQSNTPTAGTPVPSGIRSASPSGSRPRPKVPERKSSLHSSVSMSSSSTSLSSNTSDSLKSSGPPAPPPLPPSSSSAPTPPLAPVRPPSPPQTRSPPPGCSTSPEFPPPPSPETLFRPDASPNGGFSPPPPPLPSFVSFSSSPSPVTTAPVVPNSPAKSPVPLVTASALRSVQLRSVRRTEETETRSDSEKSYSQQRPASAHREDAAPSSASELLGELSLERSIARDAPDRLVINGKPEGRICLLPDEIEERQKALPGDGSPPVKQKPPVVAKKPKFSFVLPLSPRPVRVFLSPCDDTDAASQSREHEQEENEEETREHREESCETSAEIPDESHTPTGSDREPLQNGDAREDEDGASSTAGSVSSKEDDAGDVFDPNADESPPDSRGMVTPTPAAARTTEDLFAAIHRSKRKVLGRKESEEDKPGSHSQSPPLTPPCGSPVAAPAPARPPGSIQRQLRKSATSSDTFKALLLKKGSRSESSFRMSAAEMLRSTDPRSQRTRSECASPELSPPRSPRGKRAADEWRRYEALALSPPASSAFKYGRSRTPPSAASSKYNARCRILSSPMTVICERDGEYADANGTLSDDGGS